MITKIEIKNFQSHKNTVLEFDKGVNVICGESDNGKSAVIRAIRWVVENQPQGTEKINSNWNEDFKEPLSVKLYTEKGYVERIRDKKRNGYNICKNGENEIVLDAIGKGVPKEVTDFLNVSDVNFQFQLDPPYLLTKSAGEASKYLNEIVHLDSIDKIMSIADSDKRQLSSEQKIVEADIKKLEEELKNTEWIDEAERLYTRVSKYDERISSSNDEFAGLNEQITEHENLKIVDLTRQKELVEKIESISIPDISELDEDIKEYEESAAKIIDLSKPEKLVERIESISIPDISELDEDIKEYELRNEEILKLNREREELKARMPAICPYCGNPIKDGEILCS